MIIATKGLCDNLAQSGDAQVPRLVEDENIHKYVLSEMQEHILAFASGENTDLRLKTQKAEIQNEWSAYDRSLLARQLILFLRLSSFPDERAAWRTYALFKLMAFTNAELLTAGMPLLDSTDIEMQKTMKELLGEIDGAQYNKPADFCTFIAHLGEHPDSPSYSLIRYMYDRDAQAAVLSMASVYGDRMAQDEWTGIIKGVSNTSLQSLAERPEWWAHLYVATVMEKDSSQRTPELLEMLEKDANPIVQEKVSELREGMMPKSELSPAME
ncbi:MAG: hypothetical protein AB7V22_01210 [Kiritimatiellia bacterium]